MHSVFLRPSGKRMSTQNLGYITVSKQECRYDVMHVAKNLHKILRL